MKKSILTITALSIISLVLPLSALAHAVVKPSEVKVAQYQTYTLGVPSEKDNPTVSVRLVIPEGLTGVTPNVKNGWKISEKKTGEGEEAVVTEITWSGGSIPADQRDEFVFSAKSPSQATTLTWKTYQTYQSGEVVSWDKEGNETAEGETTGPSSHTTVVNDLATPTATPAAGVNNNSGSSNILSLVAIVVSLLTAYKVFISQK